MEKIWLSKYPKQVKPEINLQEYSSILDVFEEAVQKYGNLSAYTNMGATISFTELHQNVEKFASFLQNELKLKKGDRIAIQMPNALQFPVVLFASLKIGLVVVNTNPLYTAKEMKHQFKDSGAKAIVILANYASLLQSVIKDTQIESVIVTEIGDMLPVHKKWIVNSVVKYVKKMVPLYDIPQAYTFKKALELGAEKTAHTVQTTHEDIAFLQYTGGTTGVSKGAVLTHKNIIANMLQITEWMKPLLRERVEVVVTALPLYHIFSLTVNCLTFMKIGAENILITNPRDMGDFIKTLRTHRFTVVTGVNTLFNSLMNHPDFSKIDFSNLKLSVAGAMALQSAVAQKWKELTQTPVVEGYGLTESSPVVCCNPIDGTDQVGTIGLPVPSTEIKIINDNDQEVLKVGESGEICVRGPQVMRGYWQRPEETAKVIEDGWLKTGDVAIFCKDGFFKIVDRKKDMILVSGFNVYPNEVEDAIASHPGVLEVAAVGVPDDKSGEAVKVVVVKKDPELTADEIIQFSRKSLTSYKVPRMVEFRTELPKTNVGKILRRALRDSPQ